MNSTDFWHENHLSGRRRWHRFPAFGLYIGNVEKWSNFPLNDGCISTENARQIRQLYSYHWTLSLHGNEPNDKGRPHAVLRRERWTANKIIKCGGSSKNLCIQSNICVRWQAGFELKVSTSKCPFFPRGASTPCHGYSPEDATVASRP
jgi:hypothetical protein